MKVKYRVQHDIISGLKYIQVVKRMGLTQKSQEMIVSYIIFGLDINKITNNSGLVRTKHQGAAILREEVRAR